MHKMVPVVAMLMCKMMPGLASMLVMEYQGWKCAISLMQGEHLGEHLVRMPCRETASREINTRKD